MNAFSLSRLPCLWLAAAGFLNMASAKDIEFVEYDMANGLHVILHANDDAPVVSTYVLYHVGSKDERPDRTGFAHFFEHLMFEGTKNIDRGQIDKLVSGAGGNLNASTSFDRTDYYLNLPANELELALWIESERMLHAVVDEKGVETQRAVVKEERSSRYDNQPYGSLTEKMASAVFKDTPYAWTPIGSVQYIDEATIEEFRDFYDVWYVPNNAILAVAGDIEIEKTKKLVEAYFGNIPSGPEPPRTEISFDLGAPGSFMEVVEPRTPLPAVLHAWRAPTQDHEDAPAVDLLINILARGNSSRLYRRLIDIEQLAVNASAFTWLQEKAGLVAAYAIGSQSSTLGELDALIAEEVEKVVQEGVTDEEFQKALNQKESEIAFSFGSMRSRARALANNHAWYGDASRVNREMDDYLNVKKADLQRVARAYLKPERRNTLHYPVPEK